MRKYIAYIVMIITAFAFIIFNSQNIFDSIKNASDYGKGVELSFSISQREDADYPAEVYGDTYNNSIQKLDEINVKEKIMQRIETVGIRNAEINLVEPDNNNEGGRLNIRFSPISEVEKENLKTIILKDGSLSVTTAGNSTYLMQSKNEFFAKKNIASVAYDGTTPFISISLKDTASFDNIKSSAEVDGEEYSSGEDNDNHEQEDGEEEKEEKTDYKKSLFIWSNLVAGPSLKETFDKALGLNDEKVDDKYKNKLLAIVNVDDYSFESKRVAITKDVDGSQFTIARARALTNAINSEDYGFNVEFLYENSIRAAFGASALNRTYLVFSLAILVLTIVFIIIYGISGLTSSITSVISLLITILMSNLIGFEFSIALIAGLVVLFAFSTLLSINYFEHTKNFFKKGTQLEKASKDGYKSSFILSLDAFLILLFTSLFTFLVSTSSFKTFFGVLMVGSIFTFIITMFLNKWLTYWLVKDKNDSLFPYFSLVKIKKELKIKKVLSKKKTFSLLKPIIAIGSAAILILSVTLPILGTVRNRDAFYFNTSDSFDKSYVLNITFEEKLVKNTELVNEDDYISFIDKVGSNSSYLTNSSFSCSDISSNEKTTFKYDSNSTSFVIVEKTNEDDEKYFVQYFSIVVDSDLSAMEIDGRSIASIISYSFTNDRINISNKEDINRYVYLSGDSNFDSTSFVADCYQVTPVNLNKVATNLVLIIFLINVFAFAYFLIRYGIVASLSQLGTTTLFSSLAFGLTALSSISFNAYTSFGILTAILLLNLAIGAFATKFKQVTKGMKLISLKDEQKLSFVNESFYLIFETVSISFLSAFVLSIPFMIVDLSLVSLSLYQMAMLIIAIFMLIAVFINLFYVLLNKISFEKIKEKIKLRAQRKRKDVDLVKANNDIVYVDQDGPHETIIIGLNEFKR